jgi:hypothetical protein
MQTRQNMKHILYLVKVVVNHPNYLPESIEMIAPVIIELLAKYIKTIIAK